MITASVIFFNTKRNLVQSVLESGIDSIIDHIIVIDNSPTDALRDFVCSMSDKIEYIYGQGNVGYGAGHNIAIRKGMEMGAKYHVVLNPDLVFKRGVIKELAAFADTHEGIGLMMPNVIYPDGRTQYLCKLLPTPIDMFGRKLLPDTLIAPRNNKFEMRKTGYKDIRNAPNLSGCFMFLSVDVLKKVGLFDDRFFMYFEDTDLIRRIHKVSKTVFFPKVSIIHNHAREHSENKQLLKISIISTIKYFNKWGWLFDADRRRWNNAAFDKENIIAG